MGCIKIFKFFACSFNSRYLGVYDVMLCLFEVEKRSTSLHCFTGKRSHMNVLAINPGSSSLKYQLDVDTSRGLRKRKLRAVGIEGSFVGH